MNIKRLCILGRRRATHHEQELLEIDGAVAVPIDAPNHPLAGRQRRLLPHRPEHVVQLLRRYHPVPIPIVHRERPPQVVQPVAVAVAVAGAVDGDELVQADEAVAVGVGLAHHGGGVFRGAAEAEEDAAELGEGDASVAVGVELVEDAAEVVRVVAEAAEEGGGGGERGGRGRRLGAVASCEESGDAHSFDILVFFWAGLLLLLRI